jgi:hypothetical protein
MDIRSGHGHDRRERPAGPDRQPVRRGQRRLEDARRRHEHVRQGGCRQGPAANPLALIGKIVNQLPGATTTFRLRKRNPLAPAAENERPAAETRREKKERLHKQFRHAAVLEAARR